MSENCPSGRRSGISRGSTASVARPARAASSLAAVARLMWRRGLLAWSSCRLGGGREPRSAPILGAARTTDAEDHVLAEGVPHLGRHNERHGCADGTGGAGHGRQQRLGRATALMLGRAGAGVALLARSGSDFAGVADTVAREGGGRAAGRVRSR